MKLTDEPMEVSRKLLAARRLGWLPPEALDTQLAESADALVRAPAAAGGENADPARWREPPAPSRRRRKRRSRSCPA